MTLSSALLWSRRHCTYNAFPRGRLWHPQTQRPDQGVNKAIKAPRRQAETTHSISMSVLYNGYTPSATMFQLCTLPRGSN